MKFEIMGSEEEIAQIQEDLKREFPNHELVFGPQMTPQKSFGTRRPLGEASLAVVVVTAAATTLTAEIVKDIYKFIKNRYLKVEVKELSEDGE